MTADAGLFGPDSVTWRLHADPMLWVGGLRALFLQALHPVAVAGVTSFSDYRADPWGRLMRTAGWIGVVSYGTHEEVEQAAARVRALHQRVGGTDPVTGRHYRAEDPDLLLWVHVALADSLLSVARRAGMALRDEEADAYVGEQVRAAELVGLDASLVPADARALRECIAGYRSSLVAGPRARELLRFVVVPPMPIAVAVATPARPAWAAVAALGLGALPSWARRLYGLPGLAVSDWAVDAALRGLRLATRPLPGSLREGPHLRAARTRLALESGRMS